MACNDSVYLGDSRADSAQPTAPSRRRLRLASSLVAAALLGACAAPVTVPVERSVAIDARPSLRADDDGPSTEAEFREAIEEATEGQVEAQREAVYAEAELEIVELERAAAEAEAAADKASATEELAAAEAALNAFTSIERSVELDDATNDVADAADRVIVAKTDLAGLQDIFAEETEASAKDEILRRAERSLARAEARHSIAERRLTLQTDAKLPQQERELRAEVASAKAALELLGMKQARAARSRELERTKAVDEVEATRRAAARAKAKLAKLQQRFADFQDGSR